MESDDEEDMIGFFFLFGLIKGLKILEEEVEIGFFLFLSILVLKGLDDEDDEEDEFFDVDVFGGKGGFILIFFFDVFEFLVKLGGRGGFIIFFLLLFFILLDF